MPRRAPVAGRDRICGSCVLRLLAGVAWPMWASRPDGWPRLVSCGHRRTRRET